MASQHGGHSSNNHYRLHLKFIDHRDRTTRDEVFRVTFGILDALLTRLNTADSGYYVITDDIRTIDKLLTDKATKELANINLQPAIPPDIKAKRTIFIRQVDMTVGGRTPDEICQLQNGKNPRSHKNKGLHLHIQTNLQGVRHDSTNTDQWTASIQYQIQS